MGIEWLEFGITCDNLQGHRATSRATTGATGADRSRQEPPQEPL